MQLEKATGDQRAIRNAAGCSILGKTAFGALSGLFLYTVMTTGDMIDFAS